MTRYAVYYVPGQNSALYRAASEIIGRCIYTGNALPQPVLPNLNFEALTATPCRYGLHATLKAPFKINCAEETLLDAFQVFCKAQVSAQVTGLRLDLLGEGFFALTGQTTPELNMLEERCVKHFRPYAMPLTKKEVLRRKAKSVKELIYLKDWGYHKIFDEFRFHITLTDVVPTVHREIIGKMLTAKLKPYLGITLPVDSLTLCRQITAKGPFRVIDQADFDSKWVLNAPSHAKCATAA